MKKLLSLLTTAALAITFVSCDDKPDPNIVDPADIPVTAVTLNQDTATLDIGDTLQLTATVLPDSATDQTVTWSSTNTDVATVDNGVVVAVAQGTATIIVTTQDGNKTATCEVIVNPPAPVSVTGVTLNQNITTRAAGDNFTLTATVSPENATNKAVTWTSSNEAVATVLNGVVTTISEGVAVIIVTTEDGSKTGACVLTVAIGCNVNAPDWGESLGTVTRGTQEWTISSNGITQIWSDAVTATNCQKTTFNGGTVDLDSPENSNFNADCRSNPNYPGDLFSWCAVIRFQDQLCPAPWRVPTIQDFIRLDIAMGGTGNPRADLDFINPNYITRWGGVLGGSCDSDGTLWGQGSVVLYWSQTEFHATYGFHLYIDRVVIQMQNRASKGSGFSVRCVR